MQDAVLIGAIVIPVLLILVLKSHAAVVFFSLCAGSLLVEFVGDNAVIAFGALIPSSGNTTEPLIRTALLLLPALVSLFMLRGTMGGSKMFSNLLPAITVGLVGVLLIVPLLPADSRRQITSASVWSDIKSFQDFIVAVGVVASLTVTWMNLKMPRSKRAKH